MTITYDPLDPTLQGPLALTRAPYISDMGPIGHQIWDPRTLPLTSGIVPQSRPWLPR